jgi:PKD repeat protein
MKRILLLLIGFFSFGILNAQDGVCGFDAHNEALHQQFPGSKQQVHDNFMRIRNGGGHSVDRMATYTIPVVVHVIHNGGSSNISYAQIESAIDVLNEDYQRLNADTVDTRNTTDAPYKPIASDMGIEFKLAKIDPNGECTNGVERRNSPNSTYNADDDVKSYDTGGLDAWPRDSYLNIWVVTTIDSDGGVGTTLGYAQFPNFGSADTYGVVIRHDRMGNIGTAGSGDRTLTHELGHCLGLLHTFQGACTEDNFLGMPQNNCEGGGDYCCDTPPVIAAQWSCSSTQNTCSEIPTNDAYGFDALDQFENYMSYSPCQNMFTEDQKTVVIDNLTSIGWMIDLVSAQNITDTGVDAPDVLCQAEFTSTNSFICAGSTIDFTDESYSNVTGVSWTFDGGTPATSSNATETVTYNTPGVYDVTLTATDGTNNETTTKTGYVVVLGSPGYALPYSEGFENYSAIPDNQHVLIESDEGPEWEISTVGSYGTQSAMLANFGETTFTKDYLTSGTIDLSGLSSTESLMFTFKYAYRKRFAENDEWLRFYVSNDCGETWSLRKNIHGDGLSTEVLTTAYVPGPYEWVEVEITNINSTYFVDNFRFRFEFENDNGNNLYIDDINIFPAAQAGIDDQSTDLGLSIYPNPVSNNLDIRLTIQEEGIYDIYLTNAVGQRVAEINKGEIAVGSTEIHFDASSLSSGVYFLNVASDGILRTEKLVKK